MTDPIEVIRDFYVTRVHKYGTTISGALFGLGWWFFADGVMLSPSHIGFSKYLPGLAATIGLILINSVRYDELQSIDPWGDEGVYCRSRLWLLISYLISALSIVGAAIIMIGSSGSYVGIAIVIQVASILASSLVFFVSRTEGEEGGGGSLEGVGFL